MVQGKYKEARWVLQQGLEQVMHGAHSLSTPWDVPTPTPTGENFTVESERVPLSPKLDSAEQERPLRMYRNAFSIPSIPVSRPEKAISLMAVLYNCALACHLESLSTQETLLKKSLQVQAGKLYECVLDVAFIHFPGDVDCVMLAAVNNLTHLHTEHMNTKEATTCLGILRRMLSDPFLQAQLSEEDDMFFQINLVPFVSCPLLAIAPSA